MRAADVGIAALDLRGRTGAGRLEALRPRSIRMATLFQLALALLVVGQLARVPLASASGKEAPLLFNDLLIGMLLVAGVFVALRSRRLVLDRVALFALAFAAVGFASTILAVPRFSLSAFEVVFSLAYLARWLLYFGVYLVGIAFLAPADVPRVRRAFELAVLAFAAFGIFQSAFLPGFAQMVYPESRLYIDWDPQGRRLVSTFLDPNFAGALIVMALLIHFARAAWGTGVRTPEVIVLVTALVLTLSRGAFLALLAGGAVIVLARGLSRRLLKLAGLALLVSLPLLPYVIHFGLTYNKFSPTDPSALARLVSWAMALDVLADHPVIGVGFNTYGFVQQRSGTSELAQSSFGLDGGLLFIAVMTGLVGVALYGGMFAAGLGRLRRLWRERDGDAESAALGAGVAAATVALLVQSLFLNSLLYPFLMEALWILWALAAIASRGGRAPA